MKVVGIITEYNPFHNGHQYHIEKAKELTKADHCIVIMSGNFVQRGAPAILDKFARAEMALCCGADLVCELPCAYATGSAEYFARSAVAHLNALGIVDYLCFGSESGDMMQLQDAAHILATEPPAYRNSLKKYLSSGVGFPAARQQALKNTVGNTLSALLEGPNNILAIEYLKALEEMNSSIKPVTLTRKGAGYHQLETDDIFSSATSLRQLITTYIKADKDTLVSDQLYQTLQTQIPPAAFPSLDVALEHGCPIVLNDFSDMLHYRLLQCTSSADLMPYADISPELAERIYNAIPLFTDYEDFILQLKTKNFTDSRIRRCLLHLLLGIKTDDLHADTPDYLRILGFKRASAKLLTAVNSSSSLPMITKLANAASLLSPRGQASLSQDLLASHIYQSIVTKKYTGRPYNEYSRRLVIL